jgi:hypothetical protein
MVTMKRINISVNNAENQQQEKASLTNNKDIRLNSSTNDHINIVYTIEIFKETISNMIQQVH